MEKKLSIGRWIKSSCREWQKHFTSFFILSLVVTGSLYAGLVLMVNKVDPQLISAAAEQSLNNWFVLALSNYSLTNGYNLFGDLLAIGYLTATLLASYALTKFVWNAISRRQLHLYLLPDFLQESFWFLLGCSLAVALFTGVMNGCAHMISLFTSAGFSLAGVIAFVVIMLYCFILGLRSVFFPWALADGAGNTIAAVVHSFRVTHNNFWRFFAAFLIIGVMALSIMILGGLAAAKFSLISASTRLVWVIFINAFLNTIVTIASGCLYKQLRDNARENSELE